LLPRGPSPSPGRPLPPCCGKPTKPPSMEEMIDHGKHALDVNEKLVANGGTNTEG